MSFLSLYPALPDFHSHPHAVGLAPPWTTRPPQISAAENQPLPSYSDIQSRLASALKKIRKYEDAILHLAELDHNPSPPFRTHNGIVCPDCNELVLHVCNSTTQPSRDRFYDRHSSSTFTDQSQCQDGANSYRSPTHTDYHSDLHYPNTHISGGNLHGLRSHGPYDPVQEVSSSANLQTRPPPYPHRYPATTPNSFSHFNEISQETFSTFLSPSVSINPSTPHIRRLPPIPSSSSTLASTEQFNLRPPPYATRGEGYHHDGDLVAHSSSIRRLPLPPSNPGATPTGSYTSTMRGVSNRTNLSNVTSPNTNGSVSGLQFHHHPDSQNQVGPHTYATSVQENFNGGPPFAFIQSSTDALRLPPTPRSSEIPVFSWASTTGSQLSSSTSHFLNPESYGTPTPTFRRLPLTPITSSMSQFQIHEVSPVSPTRDGLDHQNHITRSMNWENNPESSTSRVRRLPPPPTSSGTSRAIPSFDVYSSIPVSVQVPNENVPRSPVAIRSHSRKLWTREAGLDLTSMNRETDISSTKPTSLEEGRHTDQYHVFPASGPNLRLPVYEDSSPLPDPGPSVHEDTSVPLRSTFSRSTEFSSDQESGVDWSIRYNDQVKKSIDVSLVQSLQVGLGKVNCLKFSQDGKMLAVGFRLHGATEIYDVQSGEKSCTLKENIKGKDIFNTSLCFSPNGTYLATGGTDNLVRIWEISKAHTRNVFKSPPEEPISCIDFSPDGRLIASGTFRFGTFHIWNWRDGSRMVFENWGTEINDLKFSPDGRCVAVGVFCGEVRLWDVRTGQLREKLLGHHTWVYSVAFTPDGSGLISSSHSEPTVKFWNISLDNLQNEETPLGTAGKHTLELMGRKSPVFFVGISSNSRWVFSCSSSGAIRVWNALNSELQCELWPHHEVWLQLFDVSPTGGHLVSSSSKEGQIILWRCEERSD